MLPVVPLAAVLLAAALVSVSNRMRLRRPRAAWLAAGVAALPGLVVISELAWTSSMEQPWVDGTHGQRALLGDVLQLTRPKDSVMDFRGETVFRPRPFYYALEAITLERMRMGLLPDDIADHLIAARTPAVVPDHDDFPPRGRKFMNQNYLLVGKLRVAGKLLRDDAGAGVRRFEIRIPLRYAIVTPSGAARGMLDGTAYEGPRELAAGPHSYRPAPGENRAAVVWADAVDRGRSPFP
jgi:hypothetical protein